MKKEEFIVMIAKVCHEANREYTRNIGDYSIPDWLHAPEWQRESYIQGVRIIIDNPETTPKQSHESWLRVKQVGGWKYGPVKDPEKKEHPCILPYIQLPWKQRIKDHIFGGIVKSMLIFMHFCDDYDLPEEKETERKEGG
jgi:hypothetical protein